MDDHRTLSHVFGQPFPFSSAFLGEVQSKVPVLTYEILLHAIIEFCPYSTAPALCCSKEGLPPALWSRPSPVLCNFKCVYMYCLQQFVVSKGVVHLAAFLQHVLHGCMGLDSSVIYARLFTRKLYRNIALLLLLFIIYRLHSFPFNIQ